VQSADNSMLTELGKRLVSGSLSDATLQRATEATADFAILPWVNVVKIGGQSIMDRGRSAVMPLIDEIVGNLAHYKMILGTGAGTRRGTSTASLSTLACRWAFSLSWVLRSPGKMLRCSNTFLRSTVSPSSNRRPSRRCRIT